MTKRVVLSAAIAAGTVLALSCTDDGSSDIFVDLRTDLVPGVEFFAVRTRIVDPTRADEAAALRNDAFLDGQRIASFSSIPNGERAVEVTLLDRTGLVVAERSVRVSLSGDFGITVVVTRDCRGVVCPGAGDDITQTSCLSGRCVDPSCIEGTEPTCPMPECTTGTECAAGASCATARCTSNVCLYAGDDAMCAVDEYCEAETGCARVPDPPDGGIPPPDGGDAAPGLDIVDVSPRFMLPTAGGELTIPYSGDATGLAVTVGGAPCGGLAVGPGSATCTVPAGTPSTVDITITNAASESSTRTNGFTYVTPGNYQHGGPTDDRTSGIAIDAQGNVYVTGATDGDLDGPGAGDMDALLVKYRADGGRDWVRQLGTGAWDYSRDVAVGPGGDVWIAGYGPGDIDGSGGTAGLDDVFVARYRGDGTLVWVAQTGSAGADEAWDLGVDAMGNAVVAGRTDGDVDGTNTGGLDYVLWRFDPAGDLTWARQVGTTADDWGHSVAVAPDGTAYLVGYTMDSLEMGVANAGMADLFIARYAADGSRAWIRQRGSSGDDRAHDALVDFDGNVWLSGYSTATLDGQTNAGGRDVIVMGFDPAGNHRFTRQWGSAATEQTWGLSADLAGNVYIPGVTGGAFHGETNAGGNDFFLIQMDPSGTRQWTRIFGTGGADTSSSCATDALHTGLTYISLITDDSLDGMPNRGNNDIAVAKVDASGNLF